MFNSLMVVGKRLLLNLEVIASRLPNSVRVVWTLFEVATPTDPFNGEVLPHFRLCS